MNRNNGWIIFCWTYVVGLLLANINTNYHFDLSGKRLSLLLIGLVIVGTIILRISSLFPQAIAIHKWLKISYKQWLAAIIVVIWAIVYFQWRIPQPHSNDISYQVSQAKSELVQVTGKVLTEPRLNSSQRLKFWLSATKINDKEQISGKLYVTVPLLQGTGINPGEQLRLKGILYLPQTASNPGGFDFKEYLARQGIFAGMQGFEVITNPATETPWGWWKLRRRIVRSQLRGLGSPQGQLVSSMVLGRKAVDLPADIRDRFIEAGLAHVLAASGFHVSLLLGIILRLTNRFAAKPRLIIGIATLLIYLGLTGIQASVLRACLMGVAVLLASALETKTKPLGSLLLAATIILLLNPLLIGDLGFQLSFLATFGLIVTLPGLQTRLDWLPPTVAILIAVPLAASIWVLPLLGYVFHTVATYSIVVNILTTPLITVISLGGMISAIAALIIPALGSAIAWLLSYPTFLLVTEINFFTNLPGSSWAIGQIPLSVLLIIYGLFLLVWQYQWWRNRWQLVLLLVLSLIVVPTSYQHFKLTQVTVLATQPEPIVVIQDWGKVILINSGEPKTVRYNLLPFLSQQGINHLDYAIDLNPTADSDWLQIGDRLKISHIISNSNAVNPSITTNSLMVSFDSQLSVLKLETPAQIWLIIQPIKDESAQIQQYIQQAKLNPKPIILVGSKIATAWLELQPQIIMSFNQPPANTRRDRQKIKFYNLKQTGAIVWKSRHGFSTTKNISIRNHIF